VPILAAVVAAFPHVAGAQPGTVVPSRTEPAEPRFEIGGGVGFAALGSYDVGAELGGPAGGNDLGPGTLGFFVTGDVQLAPVRLGIDAGLAIGGLVRTDERYFGGQSNVGSTATVWLRSRLAWTAVTARRVRLRLGGTLGVERMSEATGAGGVQVDSLLAGPSAALVIGRGLVLEVHADLHSPFRAAIGDDDGNPTGAFYSAGVRVAYVFGVD
jgi:hypothetical protein